MRDPVRPRAPGVEVEVRPADGGRIGGLVIDGWDVIRRSGPNAIDSSFELRWRPA